MENGQTLEQQKDAAYNVLLIKSSEESKAAERYRNATVTVAYLENYVKKLNNLKIRASAAKETIIKGRNLALKVGEISGWKITATQIVSYRAKDLLNKLDIFNTYLTDLIKKLDKREEKGPILKAIEKLHESEDTACKELGNLSGGCLRKSLETIKEIDVLTKSIGEDGMSGNLNVMLSYFAILDDEKYEKSLEQLHEEALKELVDSLKEFNEASVEKSLALAKYQAINSQYEAYKKVKC